MYCAPCYYLKQRITSFCNSFDISCVFETWGILIASSYWIAQLIAIKSFNRCVSQCLIFFAHCVTACCQRRIRCSNNSQHCGHVKYVRLSQLVRFTSVSVLSNSTLRRPVSTAVRWFLFQSAWIEKIQMCDKRHFTWQLKVVFLVDILYQLIYLIWK